jgi:hypothetical protein
MTKRHSETTVKVEKRSRNRADEGLSRTEREFVHAMRAMFLKGDKVGSGNNLRRRVNPPEGDESKYVRRPRNLAKAEGSGHVWTAQVKIPQGAGKRKVGTVKKTTKSKVEKAVFVKRLSPSKVRRAEKRKALQESQRKTALAVRYTSLKSDGPVKVETRKILPVGRLSAVTPQKGVSELEVVEAFGGAKALDMLASVGVNEKVSNFKSCYPLDLGLLPKFKLKSKIFGLGEYRWTWKERDYSKASAKVDVVTQKLRTSWHVPVPRKKEIKKTQSAVPKIKAKAKAPEKKSEQKAKTPSQVRRLERRQKARLDARVSAKRLEDEEESMLQSMGSVQRMVRSINSVHQQMMNGGYDHVVHGSVGTRSFNIFMKQIGNIQRTASGFEEEILRRLG